MDSDYLNRCMERYWKRWESFARQQCFNRFIPLESHEVLMDAIMTLLRQPESEISDLIRDEKIGRPVILCWVYKAIINYAKIYHVRCLRVNLDYDLMALADDSMHKEDEVSDDLFNSVRNVTACVREEDFLNPYTQCYTGRGHLYRYVTYRRSANGQYTPRVMYQIYLTSHKHLKSFADKQKAVAFLNAGHQGGANKVNHQLQGYEKVS